MDAACIKQLRQRIEELLEECAADPSFDERARRLWLVDHLEDYVSRWRGFCDHPPASQMPLTDVPGYDAVCAGIEATSQVLENLRTPDPMLSAWTAVRAAMARAVAQGGNGAASQVHDQVIELQALVTSVEN